MTVLGDERVRFYLRNQAEIDEWASLKKEAASVVDDFLHSLLEDITDVAADLGLDADPEDLDLSKGGVLLLRRSTWPRLEDGAPEIGIGLAWDSSPLLHGPTAPYSGLRIRTIRPLTIVGKPYESG